MVSGIKDPLVSRIKEPLVSGIKEPLVSGIKELLVNEIKVPLALRPSFRPGRRWRGSNPRQKDLREDSQATVPPKPLPFGARDKVTYLIECQFGRKENNDRLLPSYWKKN
ncbi:hypothetical protein PoB_002715100 [Plakobranchus ocellatus]|uniref:Uncharacterized protein n=1 Tax=Plakobranchus ocellatus TaxID=259542 RepID=A0AAV4A1P4_9GAST|nr:hypothetical protein PoB_002715100 [Plakobranchus ocellatus]